MSLKSLEKKYNKLDRENEKHRIWEKAVVSKLNEGKLFSLNIYTLLKKTPIDWNTLLIVSAINTSTLKTGTPEKTEYSLNMATKNIVIKGFKRYENKYEITCKDDTKFTFLKLTDVLKFDNQKEEDLLLGTDRSGHCHRDSVLLSQGLDIPNKVVNGYCTSKSKKMRFPHTWIELDIKGNEWVFDYTQNLAIEKVGFYALFNPQNVIEIDNETLKNDMEMLYKTSFKKKDIRMYLFFPDETRQLMLEELQSVPESETVSQH